MIQKIKNKLIFLSSLLILVAPAAIPSVAWAADSNPAVPIQTDVCHGATQLEIPKDNNNAGTTSCTNDATGTDKVNSLIKQIINIISVIVGVIAVIMIIVGGFKYITSGGEAEKVKGAKNTILYALIGLIVVALAQIIVKFVLTKTV